MSHGANGSAPSEGFQRRLGLFDATMLVVGTMIGSGIFVTTVDIARDTGAAGWLMVVWAVAGVMTVLGALSYAELAGMMPHAGGQYVYLREAYSPLYGFLYGWTCFLVIQTGSIAAVAVAFAKYLGALVPWLGADPTVESAILLQIKDVNLKLFLPLLADPVFEMKDFVITNGQIVAVAVIVILTWLNCRGVQEGKIVQNIMTIAKTAALLLLIIVGLFLVKNATAQEANWSDPWSGITQTDRFRSVTADTTSNLTFAVLLVISGALVGALFSADAWNNVTFTAGETKNPKRNIPLSLTLGAGSVIILYLFANWAYLSALPVNTSAQRLAELKPQEERVQALEKQWAAAPDGAKADLEKQLRAQRAELTKTQTLAQGIAGARDDRVATAVMDLWYPSLAVPFIAIAVMISTFGCTNGMILMGARLYYVMAQDNLFFRSVGTLNRHSVPAVGLILQSAWSILLVFSGTYNDLLDYVIFAVLLFYALTVIGLFILRRTRPDAERPYRAFGYPLLPGLYVLLCTGVMISLLIVKPKYTWPGLIIVLAGIPVYFLWRLVGKRA